MNRRQFISSMAVGSALSGLVIPEITYAIETLQLGGTKLRSISDGFIELPVKQVLPDQSEESVSQVLSGAASPMIQSPCNLTMMADGQNTVIFDVGGGPNFLETTGKLEGALIDIDLDPADVTHVMFTHAHPDHLWGLLDDFDELLFPNASYLISEQEWDFWTDERTLSLMPEARQSFAVGARRLLLLLEDQIIRFKAGQEIISGVHAIDTGGHTPGHISFEVRGGSESAFVIGDALTNSQVSFEKPDWRNGADQDSDAAVKSRHRLLDLLVSQQSSFIGYHLQGNGVGRAERAAGAYRYVSL